MASLQQNITIQRATKILLTPVTNWDDFRQLIKFKVYNVRR